MTGWGEDLGEVDDALEVGARIMRHEFETGPDAWDDSFYRKSAASGVTVVPLINTNVVPVTAADRQAFAEMVRAHVLRYGPGGSFWRENPDLDMRLAPRTFEVMNEPYIQALGGPYNPAGYAALIKRTAELVRPTSPEARLAMAGATTYVGGVSDGSPWLDALYAAEPRLNEYFDVLAVHPYGHDPDTCDPNFRWCFRQVEKIKAKLDAHGAAGKRLIITEVGNNTGGASAHSEAEQAAFLKRYVELSKAYGYVDMLLYYNHHDLCSDRSNKECWFGLTRLDGSRKPAFDVLRAAAQANP